jgi:hypothetical protein
MNTSLFEYNELMMMSMTRDTLDSNVYFSGSTSVTDDANAVTAFFVFNDVDADASERATKLLLRGRKNAAAGCNTVATATTRNAAAAVAGRRRHEE